LFISYEVKVSHLWNKFKEIWNISDLPIYSIQKNTTWNIGWVEQKIKEAKLQYSTKIIIIDHLWFLMPRTSMKDISQNYSTYIGQICRDLKVMAIKENVVIIMPVHIKKVDWTPDMNSLAWSAAIAQESDSVMIINRPRNTDWSTDYYSDHSQILMVKNRKTGQNVQWYFQMYAGRFVHDKNYVVPEEKNKSEKWSR